MYNEYRNQFIDNESDIESEISDIESAINDNSSICCSYSHSLLDFNNTLTNKKVEEIIAEISIFILKARCSIKNIKLMFKLLQKILDNTVNNYYSRSDIVDIRKSQLERIWYFFADIMQDTVEWSIVLKKTALLFRGCTWIVDERLDNFEINKTFQKYRSISQAIIHTQDTDRIVVYSSAYTESVIVNKALIIESVNNIVIRKKNTSPLIVDAYKNVPKELRNDKNVVEVKKGNVMFKHCQIRSKNSNGVVVTEESGVTMFSYGIMLIDNTDCIIRQSEIHKNSYNGVAVLSKERLNIKNCKITKNLWNGVSINTDKGVARLFDNIIFDNKGFVIYYVRSGVGGINVDNECYNNKKGQVFTLSNKIN
ncbi:hypothetical protein ABK040_015956 [Willaertia magna]